MNEVLEQISRIGIVPVVKIDRVEDAVPLAAALCNGGLPCAVTFHARGCSKRSDCRHQKGVPGNAAGRRNSADHKTGR